MILDKFSVEVDKTISAYSEVCIKFRLKSHKSMFLIRSRAVTDGDDHHTLK
jgi:hypothetical protein